MDGREHVGDLREVSPEERKEVEALLADFCKRPTPPNLWQGEGEPTQARDDSVWAPPSVSSAIWRMKAYQGVTNEHLVLATKMGHIHKSRMTHTFVKLATAYPFVLNAFGELRKQMLK